MSLSDITEKHAFEPRFVPGDAVYVWIEERGHCLPAKVVSCGEDTGEFRVYNEEEERELELGYAVRTCKRQFVLS